VKRRRRESIEFFEEVLEGSGSFQGVYFQFVISCPKCDDAHLKS
jgi:hypothetical protein